MRPMGIILDLDAARKAQTKTTSRVPAILVEYAGHLDGVTPEQLQHVMDGQGRTLQDLEGMLSRYRDLPEAMRAFWHAWHSPGGRQLTADEAVRKVPGIPTVLLETAAAHALAKCDQRLRRLASEYDPVTHGALLVLGPTGSGKSLAFAQAAFRHAMSGRRGTVWTTASRLVEARRGHRLGAGEAPAVEDAQNATWLILDELGWERGDPGPVLDVLSARYDSGRVVCVTSGLAKADIATRYGEAVIRRIEESSRGTQGHTIDLHPKKSEKK
jgi:hypothetical protein